MIPACQFYIKMATQDGDFSETTCDKIGPVLIQGSDTEDMEGVAGTSFQTHNFYGPKLKHLRPRQHTKENRESVIMDKVPIIDMSGSDVIITVNNTSDSSMDESVATNISQCEISTATKIALDQEKLRSCRKKLFKPLPNYDDNDSDIDFDLTSDLSGSDSDVDYVPKCVSNTSTKGKKGKGNNFKTSKNMKVVSLPTSIPTSQSSGSQSRGSTRDSQLITVVDDVANRGSQSGDSTNPSPVSDATNNNSTSMISASAITEKPKYTKKTRIKQKQCHEWFNNARKRNRNSGKAYKNKCKGTNVVRHKEARKVGSPCKCKNKCFTKLGTNAINAIFSEYWSLGDYNLQTADLQKKISKNPPKRKRTKAEVSRVTGVYSYNIQYLEKDYKVCKEAFLAIHGIRKHRVLSAYSKQTAAGSTIKDRRGTNPNAKKNSDEIVNCVHEHIQSLPVRSSHYTRTKNPNRQFVDYGDQKSIAWLHARYEEWMPKVHNGVKIVKYSYYNQIFSNNYNISFKTPRSDTCDTCAQLHQLISNAEDPSPHQIEYEIHMDKAETAKAAMKEGEDPTKWDPEQWVFICMDLQQTMQCPKTTQGSGYYKRKVNLYNFCIYDIQTRESYMFVWEEYTARRGSVEIYSCLYKWIQTYVLNRGSQYPRNLKIFADNCGGQNKNNNLCLALLKLVHENIFERIELCFLVPGHSYSACDRAFGCVESRIKKCYEISSPELYYEKIQTSRGLNHPNLGPFPLYNMKREDFLNIEIFTKNKQKNRLAYIRPTKDKVFQLASQVVMKKSFSQGYILKKSFLETDEEGKEVKVHPPHTKEEDFDLSHVVLKPKYSKERRLDPLKIKDLKFLRNGLEDAGTWIDELAIRQSIFKGPYKGNEDEEEIEEDSEPADDNDLDKILEYECVKRIE